VDTVLNSRKAIQESSLTVLKEIPTVEYTNCFEKWKKRWNKCIAVKGNYFEGDKINLDE